MHLVHILTLCGSQSQNTIFNPNWICRGMPTMPGNRTNIAGPNRSSGQISKNSVRN